MISFIFNSYLFIGLVTAVFTMVQFVCLERGIDFFSKDKLKGYYKESKAGFEKLQKDHDCNSFVLYLGILFGAALIGALWITIPYNLYKKHMKK